MVYGIFSILMGRLADKYDIRKILFVGGLAFGAGLYLSSTIHSKWELFLFYGLMVGAGLGAGYVPLVAFLSRDFTKRKGLALGTIAAGIGFGTLVMSQLIGYYLLGLGWRTSFTILALMNFTVIMMASMLLRIQPKQFYQEIPETHKLKDHTGKGVQEFNIRGSIRTVVFWTLCFCFLFWCLGLFMLLVHLVPYMTDIRVSPQNATNVLSLIGLSSILGKVFLGNLSDRIKPKLILIASLSVQAGMIFWVIFLRNPIGFYIFGVLFGFSYGGVIPMFPVMTSNFFGLSALGILFGILMFASQIGGSIGPILGGFLFDRFGSYSLPFALGLASVLISMILSLTLKEPVLRR